VTNSIMTATCNVWGAAKIIQLLNMNHRFVYHKEEEMSNPVERTRINTNLFIAMEQFIPKEQRIIQGEPFERTILAEKI